MGLDEFSRNWSGSWLEKFANNGYPSIFYPIAGLFVNLPVKDGMLTSCCGSSRSSFPPWEYNKNTRVGPTVFRQSDFKFYIVFFFKNLEFFLAKGGREDEKLKNYFWSLKRWHNSHHLYHYLTVASFLDTFLPRGSFLIKIVPKDSP